MTPTGTPQFNTAEYSAAGEVCKSCKQPLSGSYYRINGMQACQRCAEQVRQQVPKDSHAAYVRAITLGIGAAILGFILFAGFVIITGISLGYISLAVGFLVGKAMKMGSSGIGGRRYQIVAAILTYAAVSMAAIPIAIHYQGLGQRRSAAPESRQAPSNGPSGEVDNPPYHPPYHPPPGDSGREDKPKLTGTAMLSAFGMLALLGLASPFLELSSPLHGIIGLVILFVGIRIAWQLTAGPKLDIMGPFQVNAPGTLPTSLA
jgi:hypothetical protein